MNYHLLCLKSAFNLLQLLKDALYAVPESPVLLKRMQFKKHSNKLQINTYKLCIKFSLDILSSNSESYRKYLQSIYKVIKELFWHVS